MPDRAVALTAGEIVGRYRIVAELARGGFGRVFRAQRVDAPDAPPVALKVLHHELVQNREAVLRFSREARMLGLLRHPNVVEIYEFGDFAGEIPYIAMEYLTGEDLRQRLAHRGRMAPDEVLDLLGPVCSALDAAHAKGIVHRDIKASNVFASDPTPHEEGARSRAGRTGNPDIRVVLLDFGIAKLIEETGPALTASRHVVGTPSAMAPEQISGDPVDERTDVYALGVLAFHMLTARLPFFHENTVTLQEMHLHELPPAASHHCPVPGRVDDVLRKAMAKDPGHRPAGAAEFLAELTWAIRGTASAPAASPDATTAVAVYADLRIDPDAFDAADEALLAEIEAVLPRLCQELESRGFEVASRSGDSALLLATAVDVRTAAGLARGLHSRLSGGSRELAMYICSGPRAALERIADWVPPGPSSPGVFLL